MQGKQGNAAPTAVRGRIVVMDVKDIALSPRTLLHGRYEVQEVYYWGHTGIIYLAADMEKGMMTAIKEYCPYSLSNRDLDGRCVVCKGNKYRTYFIKGFANFLQECEIVKRVSSIREPYGNCTVQYLDSFTENGTGYLVTHYIEGMNLKEYMDTGQAYSVEDCVGNLIQIVRQVHKLGILHRDIKPSNIIMRPDNRPVLIDFGSACYAADSRSELQFVSNGYSAPELYRGSGTDARTDVYSMGALIYYMLTGCRLPPANEITADEPVPNVSEYALVTEELEQAVMRAIEPDWNKRAADMDMLAKALKTDTCMVPM